MLFHFDFSSFLCIYGTWAKVLHIHKVNWFLNAAFQWWYVRVVCWWYFWITMSRTICVITISIIIIKERKKVMCLLRKWILFWRCTKPSIIELKIYDQIMKYPTHIYYIQIVFFSFEKWQYEFNKMLMRFLHFNSKTYK